MLIIVIDNTWEEFLRLVELLEDAFPQATVIPRPEEARTFKQWSEVLEYIREAPKDLQTVLCLDLGLTTEDFNDAMRGLEVGATIRGLRREWVLVAYTRFTSRVASEPNFLENFDGMLEKASFYGKNRTQRLSYVQRGLEAAIRRKTNTEDSLPEGSRIIDSMGMRVFRAAFGDSAIAEIVRNEGGAWSSVNCEAITTGHSGAFMLSVSGESTSGWHSLVLKVARDQRTIEQEIRAQHMYLGQLGALAGHLAVLDSECVNLSAGGVYYRQAMIDGEPLLDLLKGKVRWGGRDQSLRRVVDLCLNVCSGLESGRYASISAGDMFKLSAIDVGRVEASVSFLRSFGAALVRHGLWQPQGLDVGVVGDTILNLARGWVQWQGLNLSLLCMVQHGDLNPGNIIIARDGSPVLIDLARLGNWPAGYDLARLALMFRLRLVDSEELADHFHFGLSNWLREPAGATDAEPSDGVQVCFEATYCDQRFGDFLSSLPESRRALVGYGYRLGTLWDLLKVISYQDASPYKRLWALIEAFNMKARLDGELLSLRGQS